MTTVEERPDTPFPAAAARYVLWGRPAARHKWRAVGTGDTGAEALRTMEGSGIKNGEWYLDRDGVDPNEKQPKE